MKHMAKAIAHAALLIAILLLPHSLAIQEYYTASDLTLEVTTEADFKVVPKSDSYTIRWIKANLTFAPEDNNQQKVLSIENVPDAFKSGNVFLFQWDEPVQKNLEFRSTATVKTFNNFAPVTRKISFPLQDIPDDIMEYAEPSPTIDSDDKEIIAQATQLAEGEDDLFIVLAKLAIWTKQNIRYDLQTLTAEVSQKASWVYHNRYGVCDELTNLFIAMARSLGVPARFVSGISYTNEPGIEGFAPHGWAEAYFPDIGWVPFDVTFGEMGFLDPSHVKLKAALDPEESSVAYRWFGSDVGLETGDLDIGVEVKGVGERAGPAIVFTLIPAKQEVGFGSYNLLRLQIENTANAYRAFDIALSVPDELTIVTDERQPVILRPGETKEAYWIVKVADSLAHGYRYAFPVTAYTDTNATADAAFTANSETAAYERFEMQAVIDQVKEEEAKSYSTEVTLSCTPSRKSLYLYEIGNLRIDCTIRNAGNTPLEGVSVCLGLQCGRINLGIGQRKEASFTVDEEDAKLGKRDIAITAKNGDVAKAVDITVEFLDNPKVEITKIRKPQEIPFDSAYALGFTVEKASYSIPKDVLVELYLGRQREAWTIDELSADKPFEIIIPPKAATAEEVPYEIIVTYHDANTREYQAREEFSVRVTNLDFIAKATIFLNGIGDWIVGLFG